jgi:hypothetical protein
MSKRQKNPADKTCSFGAIPTVKVLALAITETAYLLVAI